MLPTELVFSVAACPASFFLPRVSLREPEADWRGWMGGDDSRQRREVSVHTFFLTHATRQEEA